jgi:hypothetical protein
MIYIKWNKIGLSLGKTHNDIQLHKDPGISALKILGKYSKTMEISLKFTEAPSKCA